MNEHTENSNSEAFNEVESADSRLEWETPELIVEDIQKVTRGGTFPHVTIRTDDAYYS